MKISRKQLSFLRISSIMYCFSDDLRIHVNTCLCRVLKLIDSIYTTPTQGEEAQMLPHPIRYHLLDGTLMQHLSVQ